MAVVKVTKSLVDRTAPGSKDRFIWDGDMKGFGLKVTPAGSKVYIFQYRFPPGAGSKVCRATIGKHGSPWTPETARAQARTLSGRVASGEDPRATARRTRSVLTISELCDRYLIEGTGTKKASTLATDRGRIDRHIKPLLGDVRITELTAAQVKKFQTDIADGATRVDIKTKKRGRAIVRGGRGTAARTIGLLGGIFTFAVELELIERNPVHGVKRFADKKNERFLSGDEIAVAGELLKRAAICGVNSKALNIIRLLIVTGARRGEIQNLMWREVNLDLGLLQLQDSKTGQRTIRLNSPAKSILRTLAKQNPSKQGYVFPNADATGPFNATSKIWANIRSGTPLANVRLHDLRHSFASAAIAHGTSLSIIGKLLGHANIGTTQRYAHLTDDPISNANEAVGALISDRLGLPIETDTPPEI